MHSAPAAQEISRNSTDQFNAPIEMSSGLQCLTIAINRNPASPAPDAQGNK